MKIGEAVAALGIVQADGDIAIVRPSDKGMVHYTLAEVENVELRSDTYLATGTFGPGTITRKGGRSAGNLIRINELPFDFDLSDFTGIPKADLWAMPDEALWPLIEAQREAVEFAFRSIGLTLHRIDYTGYGLAGYLKLPLHKPDAIPVIQALHVRIVERINAIARVKLCDPQVKDAGTRIMRLPGCLNTKGEIHRLSRTLTQTDGLVTEAQLQVAAGATSSAPARIVPVAGSLLDEATTDQLIAAVQPHWTLGQKHHLALAISGLLAKAGVPEEQTLSIISRLAAFDDKPWDREKCVNRSYERVRSGDAVKGFYGLREVLPPELTDWLDGIAQRIRQSNAPILSAGGKSIHIPRKADPESVVHNRKPVPDVCFRGIVGDYVDLVTPLCEAPKAFHLASVLTLIGAIMGRSVAARYVSRNLHPNLYTMLVGPAGTSRKDTAIDLALALPEQRPRNLPPELARSITPLPYEEATDVGSAEGLVNVLSQTPNVLLHITEYQRLVRNAHRQSTGTIFPLLTTAWNTPGKIQNTTKGNPLRADFPCVSILAAVQPGILAQEMQQEDIESGFATRWLYIVGDGEGDGIPEPPEIDEARAFSLYRDLLKNRQRYVEAGENARLYLDPPAKDLWTAWYESDRVRPIHGEDEASMKSRLGVHVRKVALVYAAADGDFKITVDHLEAAIAFIEWCWGNTRDLMRSWGVGVWVQIENRIEVVLKEHGAMARKDLAYYCRHRKWSAREFTQVLDSMIKNGTVTVPMPGIVEWG